MYNKEEFSIHGYRIHGAVDYSLLYGRKIWQRDPYDMYLTARNYLTHTSKKKVMGESPLFVIDKNGLPLFADQV